MHPTLDDPESFYRIVWMIVRQVPRGQVTTFGQIASMIPPPDGVAQADYNKLGPRWVGDAMNAVSFSDDPTVPWHRVINAKGGISLPSGSRSAIQQRQRLTAEEVRFTPSNVVDLAEYGWTGPDADWLAAEGLLPPKAIAKKPADDGGQMRLF